MCGKFKCCWYPVHSVYEDDAHSVNPNSIRERKLQQQVEMFTCSFENVTYSVQRVTCMYYAQIMYPVL